MKDKEQIAQLEKEKLALSEQVAGLQKRVEELEGQKKPSKSRTMAEMVMELLKASPVTIEQLQKINPKYPSDVIYYARTLLHADVKTVRIAGKGTLYMTADQYAGHQADLLKAKAVAAEAKEEVHQTPPPAESTQVHASA